MTPDAKIKVMLVDDHAIVRSGFRRLLERYPEIEVVAEADTADQAYRDFLNHAPDVLVLDLSMPHTGGMEIMRRVLAREPEACIIVFSMHEDAAMVERAMRHGARGYVSKSSAPETLAQAILEVAAGRQYLSPDVAHAVALYKLDGKENPLDRLTPREFEIFQQIVSGRSAGDIAKNLNLSGKTVANYHTSVKQKLGAASDVDLVRVAMRLNLIE